MTSSSRCTHCGQDLSRAPQTGAAASQCPSCGATQLAATQQRPAPPRAPGGPPKPPPRRPAPAAPVQKAEPVNPFMEAPAPEVVANPFLSTPEASNPVVTSAPPIVGSEPTASVPFQDAPIPLDVAPSTPVQTPAAAAVPQIQAQPGAIAPSISDPHAEFRRGSWKKPALMMALAAAAGAGLFFGLPGEEQQPSTPSAKKDVRAGAVIGASVSPEIIEDPDANGIALGAKTAAKPAAEPSEAPSAHHTASSGSFSSSFKKLAK